jgi:hypothetical protein
MLAWVIFCDTIVTAAQTSVRMYQKTRFHTPDDAFGVTTVSASNLTTFLCLYEDNGMGRYLARMGGIEIHKNIMPNTRMKEAASKS